MNTLLKAVLISLWLPVLVLAVSLARFGTGFVTAPAEGYATLATQLGVGWLGVYTLDHGPDAAQTPFRPLVRDLLSRAGHPRGGGLYRRRPVRRSRCSQLPHIPVHPRNHRLFRDADRQGRQQWQPEQGQAGGLGGQAPSQQGVTHRDGNRFLTGTELNKGAGQQPAPLFCHPLATKGHEWLLILGSRWRWQQVVHRQLQVGQGHRANGFAPPVDVVLGVTLRPRFGEPLNAIAGKVQHQGFRDVVASVEMRLNAPVVVEAGIGHLDMTSSTSSGPG